MKAPANTATFPTSPTHIGITGTLATTFPPRSMFQSPRGLSPDHAAGAGPCTSFPSCIVKFSGVRLGSADSGGVQSTQFSPRKHRHGHPAAVVPTASHPSR